MLFLVYALAFVVALLVSIVLVPYVREFAPRMGWVDEPDGERKFHEVTTPTGGGFAIAVGAFTGYAFLWWANQVLGFAIELPHPIFWLGALIMLVTGMYDDLLSLGFKKKLVLQAVAAYLLMFDGYRINVGQLPFEFFQSLDAYQLALISTPLTFLWIVGLINAVNLIDGLDGLAGGIVLIGFASLAAIFGFGGDAGLVLLALPIIGAIFGFLKYNFNPASIFMGDSGSLFLGYMLAAYSLAGHIDADPVLALLTPVVALSLPVGDAALAIFRRFSEGKAICAPDHDHIHHRLSSRYTVRSAVLRLYSVSATAGALAFAMSVVPSWWGFLIVVGVVFGALAFLWSLGYLRPEVAITKEAAPISQQHKKMAGSRVRSRVAA